MRQLHCIGWSPEQVSYTGVGESTARALTRCRGSSVQPVRSEEKT